MTEQTYTGQQVKDMLGKSMETFQSSMVAIIRECAAHEQYRRLDGWSALKKVADKLEGLK